MKNLRRTKGAEQKPDGRSARQRLARCADGGVVGGLHNIGDGRWEMGDGEMEPAHPGVREFCRIIGEIAASGTDALQNFNGEGRAA